MSCNQVCMFFFNVVIINTASPLRSRLDKGVSLSEKNPNRKKRNSTNVHMNDSNHSQELQHAQVVKVPKTTLPSYKVGFGRKRNIDPEESEDEGHGMQEEEEDNVNDERYDCQNDDRNVDDDDLLDEDEDDENNNEDPEEEDVDDNDNDETEDDEDDNFNKSSNNGSMICKQGNVTKSRYLIPQKLFDSSETNAEQVSIESDLTDSLQKDRKFLSSDNDLRRIIEKQREEIEKLNSRLIGRKKLELNPIQEGHVRKLVKVELWKRIQFIRHMHILDGYECDGTIGKFVMDRLSIGNDCREGFWECYKHIVRKTLKQHRNVVHSSLRKKFIGTFKKNVFHYFVRILFLIFW